MTTKTPKQIVETEFGGRDKLISELLPLLESKDGDTKSRLKGASNLKLIKLHRAATEVKKRFGLKAALVEQIAAKKFAPHKPDGDYITKIEKMTVKRLLDLHRQVS